MKRELALRCSVCKSISKKPLGLGQVVSFEGAVTASYCRLIDYLSKDEPKVGDKLFAWVDYPVYCKVGDTFNVSNSEDGLGFKTLRLLNIRRSKRYRAKVRVEVVSETGFLSFVKRLTPKELRRLKFKRYETPEGRVPYYVSPNTEYGSISVCSENYGGDAYEYWFIYTDLDGVDHLVAREFHGFDDDEMVFGDKVLGLHKKGPTRSSKGSVVERIKQKLSVFLDYINGQRSTCALLL